MPEGTALTAYNILDLQVSALAAQVPGDTRNLPPLEVSQQDLQAYSNNNVWTRDGANQVLSRNVTVFVNDSLNILLSPDRNGLVLFRAQFVVSRSCNVTNCLSGNKNGDSLETCDICDKCIVSSTNVLTVPQDFLCADGPAGLPANDRPSFQLGEKNSALVINEDDPILIGNFAIM